jgi:muramoyltetrapeptide carboxypeptidase
MNSRRKFIRNGVLGTGLIALGATNVAKAEVIFENPAAILPPKLRKGDLVALMAPAGAIFNEDAITKSRNALEAMGFRVKIGATAKAKSGYLAGDDSFRAKEFMDFITDPEVKAIVALRGGWGCARMLPMIDMSIIPDNPKIICGFSDITTLLLAVYRQTGLVTFHGPVGNSTWEGATTTHFLDVVQAGKTPLVLSNPEMKAVAQGYGSGVLIGGNLSIICSLIGTSFLPDFKGAILFLEETEEEPYRVDRLLTQLSLCGILDKLSGVVFGSCTKCEAEEPEKSFTLDEVLDHHFKSRSYPVVKGFSIGHIKDKFTLPVGVHAELDTKSMALTISGKIVSDGK